MKEVLSYLLFFLLSWLLTGLVRRYALSTNMLDVPNSRSSHVIPTPRGGGLAFVLCFLLSEVLLSKMHLITLRQFYAVIGPCTFVAVMGFLDDRYDLPAKWRLAGHFIMAFLAVYLLAIVPALTSHHWFPMQFYVGGFCTIIYLVWLLNLFNFMDGIDGIAAAEAICICIGGALLYALHGQFALMMQPLLLASAVGGFLLWNFPPARIFMGDAGSGFLGFVIGIFSLQAALYNLHLFACWLILAAVFITDATFTLIRRALNGARLLEAHRTHAYQQAADYAGKHWPVTVGVIVINTLWLLPLAVLVQQDVLNAVSALLLAYAPLILLAKRFNAGS